jgi:hypothetical protein
MSFRNSCSNPGFAPLEDFAELVRVWPYLMMRSSLLLLKNWDRWDVHRFPGNTGSDGTFPSSQFLKTSGEHSMQPPNCPTQTKTENVGTDGTFPVFSYSWGREQENDPAVPQVTGKREKISQGAAFIRFHWGTHWICPGRTTRCEKGSRENHRRTSPRRRSRTT